MWDVLIEPLYYPLDPSKRVFWGYCLSSAVIASLAVAWHAGRLDIAAQLRSLFNRRYWLTRSTAQDLGWMVTNNAIRGLILVPIIGSHLWLTLHVGRALQAQLGDAPTWELPPWTIATSYALCFFVIEDLSRYALHLGMHRCPWLWRFHRIHHSARILTPLTLFRVHPVEQTLYFIRGTVVFGTVSGVFIWLFGRSLNTWDVLGVGLLGFLFNSLGANLRHSHVWVSFGPLERFLISPAQHQLHHSVAHGHANLGVCLSLWDRLAGTAVPAGEYRALEFGLHPEAGGAQSRSSNERYSRMCRTADISSP
ncbi:MAG: hypothetical protein CMQ49_03185 [Gammaproteobacteria bacterium]|nr:hypothetical protein [Gammaproteobacteria bacterium]